LILAALLAQLAWGVAERRGSALRLSNGENDRLVAIIRHQQSVPALDALSPTVIYRYWKLTGEAGVDIVLLNLAKYLARAGFEFDQDDWLRQVECAQLLLDAYYVQRERFIEPPTLVNGDDLMKHFGLTRGRKIGELLELIREAQVNGEVVSAQDALRVARAHIDGK
jgi:hypothetical protein